MWPILKWFGYFLFAMLAAMVGGGMGIAVISPFPELAAGSMFVLGLAFMIMLFEDDYWLRAGAALVLVICAAGFIISVLGTIFI